MNHSYVDDVDEAASHELVPEMHLEVEVLGRRDDGVDQGHAVSPQRLVVLDEEALDDRREALRSANFSGDCDGLQGLLVAVGRYEAHGGHQLDRLQHDVRQVRSDGPGQERQGLLVLEHVLEADLVVHVGLQALDALVLNFVPF